MAITNAIIQSRRGDEANFDPDQMRPGEWAVSLDTRYVRMCFAPGICVRMATYEGFEEDMKEVQLILATCQNIQTAVEKFETLAKQHANTAEEYSLESKSWAVGGTGTRDGEDTNNSKYHSKQAKSEADRAKKEADRAAGIAGIDVAKVGTPGIVAPDGKMINIDAQGNISTIYKNYRALNQIGLDDYTDYTCLEIATAMPDNSRIVLCPTDSVTPITDIPGEKGLLIIERRNSYNAIAEYYSPNYFSEYTISEAWTKFLQVQNQRDSGWDKEIKSSHLVANLLATEPGNPLDATMGKALKKEIDALKIKTITFSNNWFYATKAAGSGRLSLIIPLDNPNRKHPTLNITSAQVFFASSGWEDISNVGIVSVTETFFTMGWATVPEKVENGINYLIRITGSITIG